MLEGTPRTNGPTQLDPRYKFRQRMRRLLRQPRYSPPAESGVATSSSDFCSAAGPSTISVTGPTGSMYKTDARTKETTVPGVFACGDAALAQNSVPFAIADGTRAGAFAHQSLVFQHG